MATEEVLVYDLENRTYTPADTILAKAVLLYRENARKIRDRSRILPQFFMSETSPSFSLTTYCCSDHIYVYTEMSRTGEVVKNCLIFITTSRADPFADIPDTLRLKISDSGELMVESRNGIVSMGYYRMRQKNCRLRG